MAAPATTFSLSVRSSHRTGGPSEMIERAQRGHQVGFDALTLGDHHDQSGSYAQNTPMLGRLLADWPDRRAGCLFLVPLWHPLLMAEHIGTLAAIHQLKAPGQTFIIQTGIGWGEAQFTNMNRSMRTRGRDIDAAIPVVKALLAGEPVDDDYFGLRGAHVGLAPEVTYDWWIGGGADAAIDRAARLGDVWYASPGLDDAALSAGIQRYRAAGGTRVALRRDAVGRATYDRADSYAADLIDRGYRGLDRDALLAGDSVAISNRAHELAALGVDEVVVRCADHTQDGALETLDTIGAML